MLPQCLEMVGVESETIQDRCQFPNEICFIGQANLVTDFRSHDVTWTAKIGDHWYRPESQRLKDNGSAELPQRRKDEYVRSIKLRQGLGT
jgi:hypothetical protein